MSSDVQKWTWAKAVEAAEKRLEARGLQRFPRPSYEYKDLGEVENVERISEEALANMLSRHLSWYSYASVELAYAKAAYSGLDEIYEALLGEAMYTVAQEREGRPVKDVLKGLAIKEDERLNMFFKKRLEQQQDVQLLEGMVKGLEIRSRAVEAEAIRRASLRRVEVNR